jgi:hypothetical protein
LGARRRDRIKPGVQRQRNSGCTIQKIEALRGRRNGGPQARRHFNPLSLCPSPLSGFNLILIRNPKLRFAALRALFRRASGTLGSGLHGGTEVVPSFMRTLLVICAVSLLATGILVSRAFAGKPVDQPPTERTVFVTGSLIPQRIKLKAVGTNTVSPIRIIDRREIDSTGRQTTRGAFVVDPSVRTTGH